MAKRTTTKSHPYAITSQEEGRGPRHIERFATLDAAAVYVREHWQGADYIDGKDGFHSDYCTFSLVGFSLHDIGTIRYVDEEWGSYREFDFHADKPADEEPEDNGDYQPSYHSHGVSPAIRRWLHEDATQAEIDAFVKSQNDAPF